MSDLEKPRAGPPGIMDPGKANVQTIYVLYLVGFVFAITMIIGIVAAYINRGKAEAWLDSHYTWAIRTFWMAVLFAAISALLSFVLIGTLGFVATAVWVIARCIVGLQKVGRNEPVANPQGWLL
jgi:uncharacterized membrane protein